MFKSSKMLYTTKKNRFLLGFLALIMLSFTLSSCAKIKARRCGDCPKFKNKRRSDVKLPVIQPLALFVDEAPMA